MAQSPQIDVVVGFRNGGDEALNVSHVRGSINSVAAFNIYVNNLTAQVSLQRTSLSCR